MQQHVELVDVITVCRRCFKVNFRSVIVRIFQMVLSVLCHLFLLEWRPMIQRFKVKV